MKPVSILFLLCLLAGCHSHKGDGKNAPAARQATVSPYDSFSVYYSFAGLGSNLGNMYPVLRVSGLSYRYTREQNSFMGKPDKEPIFIDSGFLRPGSADSIFSLVKDTRDTLVYRTNTGILSGGIHTVGVQWGSRHIRFSLHNAFDTIAGRIVHILNTNLRPGVDTLFLYEFPED